MPGSSVTIDFAAGLANLQKGMGVWLMSVSFANAVCGLHFEGSPFLRYSANQEKNTPLCSVPNCAKLVCVVAGSDSKWNPCPVSRGVVAETAIVAEHSKKSPRNLFVESMNPGTLRVTTLHSILIELMIALKIPRACAGSKLLGTMKTSNTEQTLCTCNSAVPSSMSTLPLPMG